MNETPRDRTAALMISLMLGLMQAAWQQLGKQRNELTGRVEANLEAARVTIDTLAALEIRTRGQRSDEESQVLERALAELRLNYVDEVKRAHAPAGAEAVADAPPAGEPPGDAPPPENEMPRPSGGD